VHCHTGDHIQIPVQHRNSGNSASIIASLSIEGLQSATPIDVNEEGNIDGERFLDAFRDDILVLCEPSPGKRSIVVLDNAQVHMKHLIDAACEAVGVISLYLPPYSSDFNPIELVFNTAKTLLRRRYGTGFVPIGTRIGDIFRDILYECVTPDQACNYFTHCFIPVTDQRREWANR
jgi:DDE superfamily endonuclease